MFCYPSIFHRIHFLTCGYSSDTDINITRRLTDEDDENIATFSVNFCQFGAALFRHDGKGKMLIRYMNGRVKLTINIHIPSPHYSEKNVVFTQYES